MRQIKIRYKCGGKWQYGVLHPTQSIDELAERLTVCPTPFDGNIDMETVSEYTGCKDVHGNEIYEGDIITGHERGEEHKIYPAYKVYYDDNLTMFFQAPINGSSIYSEAYLLRAFSEDEEVIGNVFDDLDRIFDEVGK